MGLEREANALSDLCDCLPALRHCCAVVAGAIFLLALDEAKYITGSYLTVNGGLYTP
jgi:hypothetical protein